MIAGYSDLQVVPESAPLHPVQEEKIVDTSGHEPETYAYYAEKPLEPASESRRVCGLASRTFWVVAIVVILVIIGAAVGGGVGGSLSKKNSSTAAQAETTPQPEPKTSLAPTSASASDTPTVTTTDIPGPSITLHRDCPSSNNTLYSITLGSESMSFRKVCTLAYLGNGKNMINEPVASLNDCINLCAAYNIQNRTEISKGKSQPCNNVCWRGNFNTDWPGQCFGSTTTNSSDGFVFKSQQNEESPCDSAAWINQRIL
ncbi:hypothetical protein K469DRAFT_567835 [Zopfia rhizophila CBS 207.26]|uniref:Uncharacterized protein n=1 Tax=Zopfia rhizophila CBS 207.26 TaxID=1314779 RepID=A0A6A6E822_9PEZI|nr:hypothetical protein K469DRAFT_567835 [Zopfia rhizophila CBS 207.26]